VRSLEKESVGVVDGDDAPVLQDQLALFVECVDQRHAPLVVDVALEDYPAQVVLLVRLEFAQQVGHEPLSPLASQGVE